MARGNAPPSRGKPLLSKSQMKVLNWNFVTFTFYVLETYPEKKLEKPFCLRGKRGVLSDGGIFSQIIYFWGNIIEIFITFQPKLRTYHTITLLVIISVIMVKIYLFTDTPLVQKTRDLSGKTTALKTMITASWWSRNEGRYLHIF